MKNFTFEKRIKILLSFLLSILFLNVYAGEGSKQTTPDINHRASLAINNSTYGSFGRYGSTDAQRLYIRIQNPNSEKVYLGFSRARRSSPTGTEITSRFRIIRPDGSVAFANYTLDGTSSNITGTEAQRLTRAQNGPNGIDGVTSAGYTPIVFNPNGMPAGDYYIEFESTTDGSSTEIYYNYYDITVANTSNKSIPGRIYSKRWAFAMDDVDTDFNGAFYVFAPDNGSTTGAVTQNGFVNKINFNGAGFRPWYFNVAFNNTGPGNSGNAANDQKSIYNAPNATQMSPKYEVFLNDPDINIWKNGTYNGNIQINGITNCGIGESNINISVFKSGTIEILLDFNGGDGIYTPGTKDVLTTQTVTASGAPPYAVSVPWNGKDGLGNTIAQGTSIPIVVTFGQAAFHFPIYDVEENQYGFSCTTVRPAAPSGYVLKFYWDDSNITYTGGTFDAKVNLTGCTPNGTPPSNCHRWNGFNDNNNSSPQYGNLNTINTWWYANRDFVTSNIVLPPFYTVALGTTSNVTCFGGNDGKIQINVTNGTGPFKYYINGETTVNTLQSLPAGTYNIKVVDANGCSANINGVVITQPAAAVTVAKTSQTDVLCFGASTGAINITASGGVAPYTYDWADLTGTTDPEDRTGLIAGTYTVTVKDSKGCTSAPLTVTITQSGSAVAVAKTSQTDVLCFGASTGAINITASGGVAPYTYDWADLAGTTDPEDRTGLPAGTYSVTVKDANGCSAAPLAITITQPASAVAVAKTSQTDVLCFGASTGAINITASGGVAPYTYDWADLAGTNDPEDRTALPAGTYTVTVKDANGCSAAPLSVTITQPASAVAVAKTSQTDVLCFGASTGAINITASGGVAPYTYDWADLTGTTDPEDRTGLIAGTYTVTVKDANGCSAAPLAVTITQPASAVALAKTSQTDVLCFGASTGTINITASGGVAPYTYDWADLAGTTDPEDRTGLIAGTYTVTVKDANGCSASPLAVTITQPASAVAVAKTSQTDVLCFGASTGAINITASGGVGPYTYDWADLAGTNDTEDRTGLIAGTYTVTVKDANGCSAAPLAVTITQPASAVAVAKTSQIDVLCFGASTGAINITASGGVAPYTYDWSDLAGTTDPEDRTGLIAGTYTVTVKDANGCSAAPLAVTITQPASAVAVAKTSQNDVLCFGSSTGAINITASGGVAPYTYDWADLAGTNDTEDRTGLIAGTYTVTVKDANGCSAAPLSVTITQPASAVAVAKTSQTDVLCFGTSTGAINITASGGVAPYTYDWADLAGTTDPEDRTALPAGTYTVNVKDANGCSAAPLSVTITQPGAALSCSVVQNKPVTSNGLSNGEATVTPIGGTPTYTYLWDNGENTPKAVALNAGTHSVKVTDANGCTTECSVVITEPNVLSCSIAQDATVKCYGGNTGKATVTAVGGNGEYTYLWDNDETTAQAVALTAGLHSVKVTDKLGYTTTCEITINQPQASLSATTTQVNVACGGGVTGSATVIPSSGTSPYTYSWDTNPVQTDATATGLKAGTYNVTVKDANLCTIVKTVIIIDGDSVIPVIDPLPAVSTINCPAEPVFAQATASDDSGTISSLTYEDSNTEGNCAGTYTKTRTWTAKDACGNVSLPVSQTIIVQDNSAPTWTTQAGTLDKTIECNDEQALANAQSLFPIANDTCDNDVTNVLKVSGQFIASEGCGNAGTYTNTWTVKDDCGNTSETFTQIITIQDTTKPTFVGELPSDITVSCDAVPEPFNIEASDNCNGDLPIVFSETKTDIKNECGTEYTLTRNWSTSDCGGNSISYTQIITVRDTTPPTGTAPADVANLQNAADIPAGSPEDIKDAADNCSGTVNITVNDTNNGGTGCNGESYILTRTYTLTDCAGNKTELVQTFTVENKVSVSGIATNVSCKGESNGSIAVTSSPGATVVITNQNNEVVGNTNLPAGTYTLTATSVVNGENQTCTATATVVITEPDYRVKISGQIINVDTNAPIANVPVTLIPQGTTTGPIQMRITGADGMYSFTGMPAGSYLVQVQDANLNSAHQLYPVDSSLFFTTLEECAFQVHNFEYGKSNLPVLGDYVWYDLNNNGIQDEWYDANNDGVVTKNIPDSNGSIDYSQWEWIDLNGDGSYTGPQNNGELNAAGFGNALSANVIIDGPNGYHEEVIVGIEGFWRDRPETANPYGDYTIKLVRDANFDAVVAALGATGLVKVLPSISGKNITAKTSKLQLHTVCTTTTDTGYVVTVTPEDLVHLDADFGVSCKDYKDIVANDDSAGPIAGVNHTTTNVLNVLPNDTLEGNAITASDVIITTVTPNEFLQLNPDGSVDVLPNAPVGTLTMVYQICEADQTDNCDTATVTVTIEAPVMTVTATSICVNDVPYIDYVVTAVNFTPVNGVTIAWADSNNNVVTTMNNLPLSGRVLWPGAVVDKQGKGMDWPGWIFENNRWIEGADGFEKLRPTTNATFTVNPSETITVSYPPADPYCTARPTFAIVANDDTPAPITASATQTTVGNVLTNDTLNGSPVNINDVTLTTTIPDPKGSISINPDGAISVAPNTPGGTYTLTYQICEKADFGNCDTAIVTVVVLDPPAPPTPVVANDDNFNNIGCNSFGLVGNVLSNDVKGVTRASLELVNFTLLTEGNNTKTDPNITIDNSGNVNVSSLTPAGTYTYSYRICDKLSSENCDTATITIIVVPNGVTETRSTACNDDSTLVNLSSLLPEGSPTTGVWQDRNNTNALQGGILNPFGLALGNYVFEYVIADQNCPRSIVLNMEINDDCKVLACGDVLVHNAFSPNGDNMNDFFKIDNIDELTCYPGNTVEIYNRWGILVFETTNYNNTTNAFDGTSRGRTTVKQSDGLPTGTYFYIITYKSLDGNNNVQDHKLDGYLYLSR
ncbi:gliding motility-associated C-terminal domain-containing protein [Flavobacterium tyrosinilyticum]|uniref:T9SS type B sorting domain-containing protein n=1 Tax=Flavobacterium tyrosinilyticum TaxID=1658740 RepID=UPI00202FB8AD|nr:gliding motility-associated C-terminal domain-containing protein [Flavobacterium tyrosinilyticum]MCM0667807.1 gliding motility-associated C-terminal domain-containing protein [Flavobacterium tyrosinilyticum]